MSKRTESSELTRRPRAAEASGEQRRLLKDLARGAKRGACTGPAVALLLGASTKTALASGCGCGCGCGLSLPSDGASVDAIDAHFVLPGGSFEGELLNSGDDWDWFTFSASAGDQLSIQLEGIDGATTSVSLIDPQIALYRDVGDGIPDVGDLVGTDLDLLASANEAINDFLISVDGTYIAAIAEGNDSAVIDNQGGYRATVDIVPEPATATLLGTALAGLGWLGRRLRKRA